MARFPVAGEASCPFGFPAIEVSMGAADFAVEKKKDVR
jgi:hypothetical protein